MGVPPPPQKVKFFIYGAILLKFKQNNFICLPILIEIIIYDWAHLPPKAKFFNFDAISLKFEAQHFLCPPTSPLPNFCPSKKVKLFIHGAILLKFEAQHSWRYFAEV